MTRYALNRWDTAADAAFDRVGGDRVPGGQPRHARPDRGRRHVAHLPISGARRRGGAAMKMPSHQTSKTQVKYSRRAILKRLGIGAGFLPLLSTERARPPRRPAATRSASSPSRWTGRHLPAQLLPHRRRGPAARDAAVDPAAARDLGSKMIVMRHGEQAAEPDRPQRHDRRRLPLRRPLHYPAMLTGGVSSPNGNAEVADHQRAAPSIDQLYADNLLDPGRRRTPSSTSAAGPYKSAHQLPHRRHAQHAAQRSLQAVHQPVRRARTCRRPT